MKVIKVYNCVYIRIGFLRKYTHRYMDSNTYFKRCTLFFQKGKLQLKELHSILFLNTYTKLKYTLLKKEIFTYEFKRNIYHFVDLYMTRIVIKKTVIIKKVSDIIKMLCL